MAFAGYLSFKTDRDLRFHSSIMRQIVQVISRIDFVITIFHSEYSNRLIILTSENEAQPAILLQLLDSNILDKLPLDFYMARQDGMDMLQLLSEVLLRLSRVVSSSSSVDFHYVITNSVTILRKYSGPRSALPMVGNIAEFLANMIIDCGRLPKEDENRFFAILSSTETDSLSNILKLIIFNNGEGDFWSPIDDVLSMPDRNWTVTHQFCRFVRFILVANSLYHNILDQDDKLIQGTPSILMFIHVLDLECKFLVQETNRVNDNSNIAKKLARILNLLRILSELPSENLSPFEIENADFSLSISFENLGQWMEMLPPRSSEVLLVLEAKKVIDRYPNWAKSRSSLQYLSSMLTLRRQVKEFWGGRIGQAENIESPFIVGPSSDDADELRRELAEIKEQLAAAMKMGPDTRQDPEGRSQSSSVEGKMRGDERTATAFSVVAVENSTSSSNYRPQTVILESIATRKCFRVCFGEKNEVVAMAADRILLLAEGGKPADLATVLNTKLEKFCKIEVELIHDHLEGIFSVSFSEFREIGVYNHVLDAAKDLGMTVAPDYIMLGLKPATYLSLPWEAPFSLDIPFVDDLLEQRNVIPIRIAVIDTEFQPSVTVDPNAAATPLHGLYSLSIIASVVKEHCQVRGLQPEVEFLPLDYDDRSGA